MDEEDLQEAQARAQLVENEDFAEAHAEALLMITNEDEINGIVQISLEAVVNDMSPNEWKAAAPYLAENAMA